MFLGSFHLHQEGADQLIKTLIDWRKSGDVRRPITPNQDQQQLIRENGVRQSEGGSADTPEKRRKTDDVRRPMTLNQDQQQSDTQTVFYSDPMEIVIAGSP